MNTEFFGPGSMYRETKTRYSRPCASIHRGPVDPGPACLTVGAYTNPVRDRTRHKQTRPATTRYREMPSLLFHERKFRGRKSNLKAGEGTRTLDFHVGNVTLYH